jgi:hypothetical protein
VTDSATQKQTQQSREADIAKLALELKKLNEAHKQAGVERLSKSASKADRELADSWKKSLSSGTATMIQDKDGAGRRIGPDGRPIGPELKKVDGEYKTETKKKGGVVSASKRADGIAQRGKTRGQMR